LKGFGKKTQDNILEGIAYVRQHEGQHLIHKALQAAGALLDHLEQSKTVIRMEVAGSLRRRKEVVKDIDIVASAKQPKTLMKRFVVYDGVARVTGHGETKSSVVLDSGIAADLRVVSDASFRTRCQHFTGSKEHNVAMRQRAKDARLEDERVRPLRRE
jgi:DNA polymerase (family X)